MDWHEHKFSQTAWLPRPGWLGVWDRLVERMTGRPRKLRECEFTVFLTVKTPGFVHIANVQVETGWTPNQAVAKPS